MINKFDKGAVVQIVTVFGTDYHVALDRGRRISTVFKHCLIFASFRPFAIGFRSWEKLGAVSELPLTISILKVTNTYEIGITAHLSYFLIPVDETERENVSVSCT